MSRRSGDHKFVCDIDGQVYHSKHKRITWDGKVVHYLNYYSRHPQEFLRAIKEDTAAKHVQLDGALPSLIDDTWFLIDSDGTFVCDSDGENIQGFPWPTAGQM